MLRRFRRNKVIILASHPHHQPPLKENLREGHHTMYNTYILLRCGIGVLPVIYFKINSAVRGFASIYSWSAPEGSWQLVTEHRSRKHT